MANSPKGESSLARRVAAGKAAAETIFPILKEKFGAAILEENLENLDPFVVIDPTVIYDFALFCRDTEELQFDLLSLVSTVDYLAGEGAGARGDDDQGDAVQAGHVEVVYILDSTVHKHRILVKVRLPRDNPRIASVEKIWRAADWHEREAFDLMGVIFEGHHNLVRILCAEDWEGHALRKDYVIPERYHGIKNIVY